MLYFLLYFRRRRDRRYGLADMLCDPGVGQLHAVRSGLSVVDGFTGDVVVGVEKRLFRERPYVRAAQAIQDAATVAVPQPGVCGAPDRKRPQR